MVSGTIKNFSMAPKAGKAKVAKEEVEKIQERGLKVELKVAKARTHHPCVQTAEKRLSLPANAKCPCGLKDLATGVAKRDMSHTTAPANPRRRMSLKSLDRR